MLRETRNVEYDIPQSWDCAIIPTHSKATKTDIQHFNVYSPAFRDVDLTIGYRWCLWEDAHYGLFLGNDSFFYGQTLIRNSVREPMWAVEAQKQTSGISK